MLAIITLALRVHDLTGSALAVSALFAATMLPIVLMAPLAGRSRTGSRAAGSC